jgi:hypothetical protein
MFVVMEAHGLLRDVRLERAVVVRQIRQGVLGHGLKMAITH